MLIKESFERSANQHGHLLLWNGCSHSELVFKAIQQHKKNENDQLRLLLTAVKSNNTERKQEMNWFGLVI